MPCFERVGSMWEPACRPCGQRLLVGPHWPLSVVTYSLMIVPTVLFVAFVTPDVNAWAGAGTTLLGCWTVFAYTVTAWKDPGVLPRRYSSIEDPAGRLSQGGTAFDNGGSPDAPPDNVQDHPNFKWCDRCMAQQPRNSFHCQDCDVCIYALDHHCVWTGKCIGKGNLTWFYIWLVSLAAYMVVIMVVWMAASTSAAQGRS